MLNEYFQIFLNYLKSISELGLSQIPCWIRQQFETPFSCKECIAEHVWISHKTE